MNSSIMPYFRGKITLSVKGGILLLFFAAALLIKNSPVLIEAREAASAYQQQHLETNSEQDALLFQQQHYGDEEMKVFLGSCNGQLLDHFLHEEGDNTNNNVFDGISLAIHRNGQGTSCGSVAMSANAIKASLAEMGKCKEAGKMDKYELESFLTDMLANELGPESSCGDESMEIDHDDDDDEAHQSLFGFCDMGPDRTVLQPDSENLVPVSSGGSLPCRFFTREGLRISSLQQLASLAKLRKEKSQQECFAATAATGDDIAATAGDDHEENQEEKTCAAPSLHLYAVPAGRVFMFAPSYVGEVFKLTHVTGLKEEPISIEVLSLEPRVFDIHNFFSPDEAQGLIDKALAETSETHGLHRSTTGTSEKAVFSKRTSENAWDTHGKLSQQIKRRCMEVLGFDEYYESHTDGLQILRYNLTKAYVPHMDYLSDSPTESYDYDSHGKGGNRFATILLYMSDLPDDAGGETVFPKAPGKGGISKKDAIKEMRAVGELELITPGSWEENMLGDCRTRLATRPRASRAVLFYSQHPDGQEDLTSTHGGCPVLKGTKWAANLWVWNAARATFPFSPFKAGRESPTDNTPQQSVSASFHNTGMDPKNNEGKLYYDEDGFFGDLGPGATINVNTFSGHKWNLKSPSGEILASWVINDDEQQQDYAL